MTLPVDQVYLENLEEYIFDDEKFVSYKWLSCKLGVHVNLSKQMLYQFLEIQKEKGKKIHAMYYISGMAPQKWISKLNSSDDAGSNGSSASSSPEFVENKSPPADEGSPDMFLFDSSDEEEDDDFDENGDAFIVSICKEQEVEEYRKHFSQIFSLHVYGLSSFPMTKQRLDDFTKVSLFDDDGNVPQHYGPMVVKTNIEFRPDPRNVQKLKDIAEVKAMVKIQKEKWEKEEALKEQKKKEEAAKPKTFSIFPQTTTSKSKKEETTTKKDTTKSGGGGGDNRLKNMFAAAASKPPAPKKIVEEEPKKADPPVKENKRNTKEASDDEGSPFQSRRNKPKGKGSSTAKNKKKQSESQKRKRIRDVFSSSEDDSDTERNAKMSDNEELPESPVPRKYQIQSDSDSDDAQPEPARPNKTKQGSSEDKVEKTGRKRVCKTVPHRHVDDEGFLVTVMEQVMVSESDHSEGDEPMNTDEEPAPVPRDIVKKPEEPSKTSSLPKSKEVPKPAATSKAAKGKSAAAGTSKQASIMSFFKKK